MCLGLGSGWIYIIGEVCESPVNDIVKRYGSQDNFLLTIVI
jgi:hypothetical protein